MVYWFWMYDQNVWFGVFDGVMVEVEEMEEFVAGRDEIFGYVFFLLVQCYDGIIVDDCFGQVVEDVYVLLIDIGGQQCWWCVDVDFSFQYG